MVDLVSSSLSRGFRWPRFLLCGAAAFASTVGGAVKPKLDELPRLFKPAPVTDEPGALHRSRVHFQTPGNPKFTVEIINLKRSLVPTRPMPGLVSQTMMGPLAHMEHLSGLLKVDRAAIARGSGRPWKTRFEDYAEIDFYAHDIHLTGLQFNFPDKIPREEKRRLIGKLLFESEWENTGFETMDWDARTGEYVAPRLVVGPSRYDWERVPFLDKLMLTLPNVASGKLVLLDKEERVISVSTEFKSDAHLRVSHEKPYRESTYVHAGRENQPFPFSDAVLSRTRFVRLAYTHHLVPRGRPDAAIMRLQKLAATFKLRDPFRPFNDFSSDRRELETIFEYLRGEYEREAIIQATPRHLAALADGLNHLGRRLNELREQIARPAREICEAELKVREARRNRTSVEWAADADISAGVLEEIEAVENLRRVRRRYQRPPYDPLPDE